MAAIHFERRFDALMKYVINSQEHPIGKVKDFIYRIEFKIRGSCHYLVTAYFFSIENIPQDISCDTRDTLVQYINSVIKTDIPHESDAELYQKKTNFFYEYKYTRIHVSRSAFGVTLHSDSYGIDPLLTIYGSVTPPRRHMSGQHEFGR